MSRHTRELLRRYQAAGKLATPLATRDVIDRFVELSPAERAVYSQVESYISTTWNRTPNEQRNAVGFVMTVYRRRLASSFAALARTLEGRLSQVHSGAKSQPILGEDDIDEDPTAEEELDADDAFNIEAASLAAEESSEIVRLMAELKALPVDTKARQLIEQIRRLFENGYRRAIVFTQFTDTLDFLRGLVARELTVPVMCYSGRGGEVRELSGTWRMVGREEIKRLFRSSPDAVLICTDAAAEGLNFQFCGALVNYDMPWNPMRVEQRIGRIDRLGQEHSQIRIVNLHYANTVETDVYMALRTRIGLFEKFVGKLQPIQARLPREIAEATLKADPEAARRQLADSLALDVESVEARGFDLDAALGDEVVEVERPPAAYGLGDLAVILARADLLPAGTEARAIDKGGYAWLAPGMPGRVRVTTDRAYFEAHPDSCELWSPRSPVFPASLPTDGAELDPTSFRKALAPGRR